MKRVRFEKLTVPVMVLAVVFAAGAANADMVALYKFESNANDSSGNNHHGIEKGNPSYVAGVSGQAIALDGKNSYVDCGTDVAFDIRCQITIACWIKVSKFDRSWQTIIARADNSWRLQRAQVNDTLGFACSGLANDADPWIRGSINVNDGRWHHVAGVYDGARMYLYVDGVLDVSQEALGTINTSTAPVYIGDNAQQKGRYFHGLIDELVIFDHALNADEIKQMYRQGAASVTSTADAVWSQVCTACSDIKLGNETGAEAATERLLGEFSREKNVGSGLFQVAETYRKLKKYDEARQFYQHIINNRPDEGCAMQSQVGVILSSLARGDDHNIVETAIDGLLTKFSRHSGIAKTATQLAYDCRNKFGKYDLALKIYRHILAHWPEDEYAMWALKCIATVDIKFGNYDAAEAGIKKILANYPNHKGLAEAFCWLGNDYYMAGQYARSRKCYQYAIDNSKRPNDEYAILSRARIANINIALGDDEAARAILDGLIADFKDNPELPHVIFKVGEEYYSKAFNTNGDTNSPQVRPEEYCRKALAVWERIIAELSQSKSPFITHAYYFSGYCYNRLGEYQKAIEYYQTVVDNWPDYEYAPDAVLMIGQSFEHMAEEKLLPSSEAEALARAAYQQVLDNYPNCPEAKYVIRWIERYDSENEGNKK